MAKKTSASTEMTDLQHLTKPVAHKQKELKKTLKNFFKELGLKIEIKTNLKVVDFLDVTFNLATEMYYPFKKPNDELTYVNTKSNHPSNVIKQIPASISRRISDLSCDKEAFERAKPYYDERLKSSEYREELSYTKTEDRTNKRKNRKRKTIWFNPRFSTNVQTNVDEVFLQLLEKHFQKNHKFHKIFSKNTVKVSYSCMENMASIIKRHNRKILATTSKIQKRDVVAEIKINAPSKTNVYGPASFTKLVFLLMRILKSRTTSDSQKEHSDKDLMDTSCHFEIKSMQIAPNYQNIFGN